MWPVHWLPSPRSFSGFVHGILRAGTSSLSGFFLTFQTSFLLGSSKFFLSLPVGPEGVNSLAAASLDCYITSWGFPAPTVL